MAPAPPTRQVAARRQPSRPRAARGHGPNADGARPGRVTSLVCAAADPSAARVDVAATPLRNVPRGTPPPSPLRPALRNARRGPSRRPPLDAGRRAHRSSSASQASSSRARALRGPHRRRPETGTARSRALAVPAARTGVRAWRWRSPGDGVAVSRRAPYCHPVRVPRRCARSRGLPVAATLRRDGGARRNRTGRRRSWPSGMRSRPDSDGRQRGRCGAAEQVRRTRAGAGVRERARASV
jgi:hypothetical protein